MSHVLSSGLASAEQARLFFEAQLAFRTDPADLATDLLAGEERIVVIDTRSAGHYAEGHIPGAISFPHATMNPASTAVLARDKVYVCYCDGIGCNGSTRRSERRCPTGGAPSFRPAARSTAGAVGWSRWIPSVTAPACGRLSVPTAGPCGPI